jgi:hypothetical protein
MSHLTSRDKIFAIENSLDTDLDRNVTRDGLRLTASQSLPSIGVTRTIFKY